MDHRLQQRGLGRELVPVRHRVATLPERNPLRDVDMPRDVPRLDRQPHLEELRGLTTPRRVDAQGRRPHRGALDPVDDDHRLERDRSQRQDRPRAPNRARVHDQLGPFWRDTRPQQTPRLGQLRGLEIPAQHELRSPLAIVAARAPALRREFHGRPHRLHNRAGHRRDQLLEASPHPPSTRRIVRLVGQEDRVDQTLVVDPGGRVVLDPRLGRTEGHPHLTRRLVERVLNRLEDESTERPRRAQAPPPFFGDLEPLLLTDTVPQGARSIAQPLLRDRRARRWFPRTAMLR